MKKNIENSLAIFSVISFAFIMLGFNGLNIAQAATTPSVGIASSYAVLASTYTNTSAGTTINGSVGYTTGPAVAPLGVHLNYGSGSPYAAAGTDQGAALSALNSQACTFTFASGAINLSTDTTHGTIGVYNPGVYCVAGAMNVGGPLTLNGNGTFIFRSVGALTSTAGASVILNGASVCDVFWTPSAATTLAANTTFKGTVISNAGITIGANTNWVGRALSFGGTTTSDTDNITAPTCSITSTVSTGTEIMPGTLRIVKEVINSYGGIANSSDFVLHVKNNNSEILGSPFAGASIPGKSFTLMPGTYTVSENATSSYVGHFSGDCDLNGNVILAEGVNRLCTIMNFDILAPLAVTTTTPTVATITPVVATTTEIVIVPVIATTTLTTTAVPLSPVPGLPSTGLASKNASSLWSAIISIGALVLTLSSLLFILKKKNN